MRSAALLAAAAVPAAGTPTMTLLTNKKCDGVTDVTVAAGHYNIRVTATGSKGFKYTCDAAYDAVTEKTDKECTGWANGEEDIALTLEAFDSKTAKKPPVCMHWQLAFGKPTEEDAWAPNDPMDMQNPMKSASDFFAAKYKIPRSAKPQNVPGYNNVTGNPDCVHDEKCNSPAMRDRVAKAYIDSMTYIGHACVDKKLNDKVYGIGNADSVFPPGIRDPAVLRVAHKALAISGTIHSVDRTCKEAWKIGKQESCVQFQELHCHTHCDMTWHLGPGGIATWSLEFLNHHIPSPGINLGQTQKKQSNPAKPKTYGDLGCGAAPAPPGTSRYSCDTAAGSCKAGPTGHETLAQCQESCGAPAPTPGLFHCVNGVCIPDNNGSDLKTCQAAC